MKKLNRKEHWEKIYQTRDSDNVSWFQLKPQISLTFLKEYKIDKTDKIIDIGGGDSNFVDYLIQLEYQDITVLDISNSAIEKAKKRLGEKAANINWIVADIVNFSTDIQFDFWHDRAAFHFLNDEKEIDNYINTVQKSISDKGKVLIGTFSEDGPKKCSGIEVQQYSENSMADKFKKYFEKIKCIKIDHETPSNKIQNFTFCSFKKKSN